jgi:two-component system phosphate regulon sensor histidine kinase PhoR
VEALLAVAVLAAGLGGVLLGRALPRRRGKERALARLSRPQLLRWLQEAPGGWLLIDPLDAVQLINPRAERLLQSPGASLLAAPGLARLCSGPELVGMVASARLQGRLQRGAWPLGEDDLEAVALPGEQGWVAVHLQSRRSLEAQLEQQERWVSDVAHELKTPLTALLLVGDSLAARVTSDNAVLVERLQRELRRLQQMVGDLLELSRLENTMPRQDSRWAPVDLAELLEQVWAGLRPLAEPRAVVLHWELRPYPGSSEPVLPLVWGDASRLHRALLNLLDNALHFSADGGRIEVTLRGGRDWWLVAVRDHGPGLSEPDMLHMFERFYRGDPARARSQRGGSGLGLAIVQQIAITHGGRVQAANHPAGGALLELLLPVGG